MASSAPSLYEVLGVSNNASGSEIKAAYRRLVPTSHPDVVAMNQKEDSTAKFMKINAAYSTLSNPEKRASYDKDVFCRLCRQRFSSSVTRYPTASMADAADSLTSWWSWCSSYGSGGSTTTRGWETDQCW